MWKEGTDLVIKRSVYSTVRSFRFVVVLLFSVFYGGFAQNFLLIDFLCLVALLVDLVWMLNRSPITIGKNGIIGKKLKQLSWKQIDCAYVSQQKQEWYDPQAGCNNRTIMCYLIVQFHDEKGERKEVRIKLNEYSYDKEEVKRAINYWSGGKIGDSSRYDDCVASNEG